MRLHPVVSAVSVFALLLVPALARAQGPGGPGPRGRGFGGRVLGVEGCVSNGWRAPSGTPGYAVQITRTRTDAVLSGTPETHTSTEMSYRDNSGVIYQQMTLPAFGNSGAPRTVICVYDPNQHIRLVINPSNMTAREFQLPTHTPPANAPNPNNSGALPPRPPRPQGPNANVTITHPAPPAELTSEISTYCNDATVTRMVRGSGENAVTSERVYCPSLRLELHSREANSHGITSTTAMITATGTGVSLASLPVPYPLPGNYAVTVVTPGPRGGNHRFNGGNAPAAPPAQP